MNNVKASRRYKKYEDHLYRIKIYGNKLFHMKLI